MKNFILATIMILTICSCSKESPEIHQETIHNSPPVKAIGFEDMQVGDEFSYLHFIGESYGDPENGNYAFTKDTLNFEVCGLRDGKFIVSERITPGSTILNEETDYYLPYADSIFTYFMFIRNDSLITEPFENKTFNSHLYKRKPINLSLAPFVENGTEIFGWKTTFPYHEGIQSVLIPNAEIAGSIYQDLNVYMLNVAMQLDGNGYSYSYNKESGMVRTATYSWWTSTAWGWEIL